MIEALKEIVAIIEKLPHMALWILAGLLFYKVVIIGSWFGIAKLLIERTHSYLTRPPIPKPPEQMYLDDVLCMVPRQRLIEVLRKIPNLSVYRYIHASHLDWLETAVIEYAKVKESPYKTPEAQP